MCKKRAFWAILPFQPNMAYRGQNRAKILILRNLSFYGKILIKKCRWYFAHRNFKIYSYAAQTRKKIASTLILLSL